MKKIYLLISAVVLTFSMNAKVIYVDSNGTGSDGDSWASAWQSIRAAIDTAHSGDQIWVKQDTYTIATALQSLYFKSGVAVYGGFVGNETTLEARRTDNTLTIVERADTCIARFRLLTGVTADDEALVDGFTFTNGAGDYGAGVMLNANNTLQNSIVENCVNTCTDELYSDGGGVYIACDEFIPAKLLNCTIRNNRIEIYATNKLIGGAGIFIKGESKAALVENCLIDGNVIEGKNTGNAMGLGAGVQIITGTIRNSTISNNTVEGEGAQHKLTCAGIHILPQKAIENVVTIENCKITDNDSKLFRGGAILIDPVWSGDNYKGEYTFESCVIDNNHTPAEGAGCLITTSQLQTDGGFTTNFNNCIISNNTADATGGALFGNAKGITLNMNNCTIVRNYGGNKYGGQVKLNQTDCYYTLKNCLIWGNSFGHIGDRKYSAYSQMTVNAGNTTSISYCAIEDGDSISYQDAIKDQNINLSPENTGDAPELKYPYFVNPTAEAGVIATGTDHADWHITVGSACIDWGVDYNHPDIEGNVRPIDGSELGEAFFDIGAYEYNPSPVASISAINSVNKLKVYAHDGRLIVNVEESTQVEVYAITGVLVKSLYATSGVNTIPLASKGIYIVRTNQETAKVSLY